MLEAILGYLHNDFPVMGAARCGEFEIVSGELCADFLMTGQYYRIIGSVFNDGVHRYPCDEIDCLRDETFTGEIWPLAIPAAVIGLAQEIGEWSKNNPATDKTSESFDGYSYTRAGGADGSACGGWQAAFAPRLRRWKKVG